MKILTPPGVSEIIRNASNLLPKGKLLFGLGVCVASVLPLRVQAQCPDISTLPCSGIKVTLPFSRAFTGTEGGLKDKNNLGTGFTIAQEPSAPLTTPSNPSVPGYEVSKLSVASDKLTITTTPGIAFLNPSESARTNSGVNALGVGFNASLVNFTVEASLLQPPAGTNNFEQAGIWFGLDEDNYIKLDIISADVGTRIELYREVNGTSNLDDRILATPPSGLSTATLRLKLLVNLQYKTAEGFYSVNGGAMVRVGLKNVPDSFITGRTIGTLANTSFAGIYTSHRNATTALNYSFGDFKVEEARPFVVSVNPVNKSTNESVDAAISTDMTMLPNGGIDNSTLTSTNVKLIKVSTNTAVAASVNGTGGRDAITLDPNNLLEPQTEYRFEITSGVQDLGGNAFVPFSSTFKTGDTPPIGTLGISFNKVSLPNATGRFSTLVIGPDKRLYATTIDGYIKRFPINADGTLGTPVTISSLRASQGNTDRMLIGLAFAPSSTASNLVAYVSHQTFLFENAPTVDAKITRMQGPDLGDVDDMVINLPRSKKDHVVNSLAFGPDGALYFSIGSNSAMGRADATWGNVEEYQLSASMARLDFTKLAGITLPLNAKTSDIGGTYNPRSTTAPLTIYASGIRSAYDLVFHSNGELYVPGNGSAAGGNTPESKSGTVRPDGTLYSGPFVPALNAVPQTQDDFLFRIEKGGYYGHPNPKRGEYVLNGGNPSSGTDPAEVSVYPVGTLPDANWKGAAFNFENNKSPNGAIEYKNNTFEGLLKNKLLVVRYSQKNDIIVLSPSGTTGDIVSSIDGFQIPGFTGFKDPLDLTEDVEKGNIYVAEYDDQGTGAKITLLRPTVQEAEGATLSQAAPIDTHAGFSGTGYADFSDTPGSFVQFSTQISTTGSYKLEFRYANGGTVGRPCNLTVNGGSTLHTFNFSPTNGWAVWQKVSVTLNLTAGTNLIKLSSTNTGPNIDYLNVTRITSARTAVETSTDVRSEAGIVLYPNPTANALSVTYRSKQAAKVEYSVLDVLQNVVLTGSRQAETGLNTLQLNLSKAKVGVYFLTMHVNGEKISKRFVIIR